MLQANGKGKCTKRPQGFNSESCKRVEKEQSDETGGTSGIAYSPQESSSPVDSLDLQVPSYDLDSSHCQHRADNIKSLAEIWFEFNDIDLKYEKLSNEQKCNRNDQLDEILRAEIALRNTSGGVLILNTKQKVTVKNRDEWMKQLYEKRKTLLGSECGEKDSFDDIIDVRSEDFIIYIYVRSSSVEIITNVSNLRQRSVGRNYQVKMYSRICEVLQKKKNKCICANRGKFITSFKKGEKLSHETETEEHKHLTSKNLPKAVGENLSDNIVAFANTQGGTVYFGIEDDSSIVGQRFKDDGEKNYIYHCIKECVKRKLWIKDSGEREDPEEDNHYCVGFFPVDGADKDTYVIAVHICQYDGTAVFSNAPECSVVSKDNEIIDLDLRKWLALHKSTPIGTKSDEEKLKKRKHRASVYYSVQETVQEFVERLTNKEAPGKLKLRPRHALKWINNKGLNTLVTSMKKLFSENEWQGIAYIERCWNVNLGLPSTKPADVICDVLVCSSHVPLILVTLTESDVTNQSLEYNKKLATMMKRVLVQEAGCLEKFYIKPVTLSSLKDVHDWANNISSISSYPDTYSQCSEMKYTNMLESLMLVLARANSMSSSEVVEQLFYLLTREQYDILSENFESKKMSITGPPGSGKTVLALQRIHRLRNEGCLYHEILFLCTNKPLQAKVERMKMQHDKQPLCIVKNYMEVVDDMEVVHLVQSQWEFRGIYRKLKHIVADEVQNYKSDPRYTQIDWWRRFKNIDINGNPPSLWIFSDVSQQIITERSVHEHLQDFPHRRLTTVIRATSEIYKFLYERFMPNDEAKLGHDFKGEKVEVLIPKRLSSNDAGRSQSLYTGILILVLHKLIGESGYNRERIAVLFSDEKNKEKYESEFIKYTRSCPVRNGEQVTEQGVVFDTIRRYSGYEEDIIVGFLPEYYTSGAQNNDALMITLGSRALLKLILIIKDEKEAVNFGLTDCAKDFDVQWDEDATIDFSS